MGTFNDPKMSKSPWVFSKNPTEAEVIGIPRPPSSKMMNMSLDWFKGKSTGNHGFYH
jgi:hypothetical protein